MSELAKKIDTCNYDIALTYLVIDSIQMMAYGKT